MRELDRKVYKFSMLKPADISLFNKIILIVEKKLLFVTFLQLFVDITIKERYYVFIVI